MNELGTIGILGMIILWPPVKANSRVRVISAVHRALAARCRELLAAAAGSEDAAAAASGALLESADRDGPAVHSIQFKSKSIILCIIVTVITQKA